MDGLFERISDDLVDDFYDDVHAHDGTTAILDRSDESTAALKGSQAAYLRELGSGTYDRSYFERRARIGRVHDMLDLGPKVHLGAYAVYYEGIVEAIAEDAKAAHAHEGAERTAVDDAVDGISGIVAGLVDGTDPATAGRPTGRPEGRRAPAATDGGADHAD